MNKEKIEIKAIKATIVFLIIFLCVVLISNYFISEGVADFIVGFMIGWGVGISALVTFRIYYGEKLKDAIS